MKKNILKATLVAAFALIAGMNVYNAQQSDVMSDLALANVEALASGSEGEDFLGKVIILIGIRVVVRQENGMMNVLVLFLLADTKMI